MKNEAFRVGVLPRVYLELLSLLIWLRRSVQQPWMRASDWRPQGGGAKYFTYIERRRCARRSGD